jgi:Tol biopolymer transport system component
MIEPNGSTNVWTQAVDGGSSRRVTADAESINYLWWSPDGQWLAVRIWRETNHACEHQCGVDRRCPGDT